MTIKPEVLWEEGDQLVRWSYESLQVVKSYDVPPMSVVSWHDPASVIVVEEPHSAGRIDNAVVYEAGGSERLRLKVPCVVCEVSWAIGFYVVYEDPDGLVAVFSTAVGDFWGRPDLHAGDLKQVAEWR